MWGQRLFGSLKKYKLNSILIRNFALILLMMTLPLAFIVLGVKSYMDDIVQKEIQEMNQMSLIRSAETMDSVLEQVFSLGYYLIKDEELKLLGMVKVVENPVWE